MNDSEFRKIAYPVLTLPPDKLLAVRDRIPVVEPSELKGQVGYLSRMKSVDFRTGFVTRTSHVLQTAKLVTGLRKP